jgi:hypothetical protein
MINAYNKIIVTRDREDFTVIIDFRGSLESFYFGARYSRDK